MYFLLGFIIGQTIAIVWLLLKIKDLVNEIKRYQYINNLKLLGFIEKKFSRFYEELGKVIKFKRKWGDKNDKI